MGQFVLEEPDHFRRETLKYVDSRPQLRDYVPPAIEVALSPTQLALPDSFFKSRADQLKMINEYSESLEVEFPDARAIMLPATAYAQADKAYLEKTGHVLFRTHFARALDNACEFSAAEVGRFRPGDRLHVGSWDVGHGYGSGGAVPAVVFLRK